MWLCVGPISKSTVVLYAPSCIHTRCLGIGRSPSALVDLTLYSWNAAIAGSNRSEPAPCPSRCVRWPPFCWAGSWRSSTLSSVTCLRPDPLRRGIDRGRSNPGIRWLASERGLVVARPATPSPRVAERCTRQSEAGSRWFRSAGREPSRVTRQRRTSRRRSGSHPPGVSPGCSGQPRRTLSLRMLRTKMTLGRSVAEASETGEAIRPADRNHRLPAVRASTRVEGLFDRPRTVGYRTGS